MSFSTLPRWPNLGYPCLIHRTDEDKLRFRVLFAAMSSDLDLGSALSGNLYLQPLADTNALQKQEMVFTVAQMGDAKKRLIPIEFIKADDATKSAWSWYDLDFEYASWITLEVRSRDFVGVRIPQLFNLILDFPNLSYYHIAFHSVYIHDRRWDNFTFAHVADTHVAWRNEEIPVVIEKRIGRPPKSYNNPNQNLRDFIRYVNARHRAGLLDFIFLNGDLVDYEWENYYGRRPRPDRFSLNNFEYFTDIIKGVARTQQCFVGQELIEVTSPVDEELEVPVFTTLGNHDFRRNEYPLVFLIDLEAPWLLPFLPDWAINIKLFGYYPYSNYDVFNLSLYEALAYEGALRAWDESTSAKFVDASADIPAAYRGLINPDGDFAFELGKYKFICLNTSCDIGILQDLPDAVLSYFDESKGDFREGSPDSGGFARPQMEFLANEIASAHGSNIISVFHAPLINIRGNTPPRLLRQVEHQRLTGEQVLELMLALQKSGLVSIMAGGPEDGYLPEGWSLEATPWFKRGERSPYLSKGVANERFEDFADAIAGPAARRDRTVLCLSGHTHHSIEYRMERHDGETRYFHDSYLDNTLDGKSSKPGYSNPLSKLEQQPAAAAAWWRAHTPLLVQTLSLGPVPSEKEPGFLLVTVRDNVIVGSKRVRLSDLHITSSSQAWYVLLGASA